MRKNLRIGDILVEEGIITQEQLDNVLRIQQNTYRDKRIGDLLVNLKYITEEQLTQSLSKRLRVPFINLKNYPINNEIVNILDEKIARRYIAVPLGKNGNILTVGMSDPLNLYAIEEIRIATRCEVNTVICIKSDIESIIDRC